MGIGADHVQVFWLLAEVHDMAAPEAKEGHLEILHDLLLAKSDVNHANLGGDTALIRSSTEGHAGIVSYSDF